MNLKRKQHSCDDYHVAWICAVANLEQLPARLMLDEEHDTPQYNTHYDDNVYTCGSINGHAVVIATCPQGKTGNVHSGRLTHSLFKTFRNISMTVLVGIGGGIPRVVVSEDSLNNIHLGDVVVGWPGDGKPACVYHDNGRNKAGEPFEMVGTMPDPHWGLITALGVLAIDHKLHKTTFGDQLSRLKRHGKEFDYPGLEHDKLFKPAYRHVGDYSSRCITCDHNEIIERPQRSAEEQHTIVFHQGRIATGNAVIQNGVMRDEISARCDGALCVEMEAAGVNVNAPCLVIRGISDYADSHKSDLWRSHAAGKAAAFARELLCRVQPVHLVQQPVHLAQQPATAEESEGLSEALWQVPLPRPHSYVGRETQLARLKAHISSQDYRRLAIYGLGGCGKTALALEAAYQTREQQPTRAIFWVPAVSQATFEQAYREIGGLLRIPNIVDASSDVKKLVKTRLSDECSGSWLMVIDNADDINIFFDSLDEGGGSNRLIDYLPYSRKGNIIFTTRTKKAALRLAENNILQLDKLSKEEAKEVLRTRLLPEYQHQVNDVATVGEFLHMLAFFALAIVQAVAFVNSNGGGLSNYLELYRASEQNATELLSEEFEDNGRYRETENPVATTWYISFEQIRKNDTLAADLLSFMACMANNDIPVSMLPASSLSIAQTKAIGTLEAYAFIQRQLQEDASAGQQVQERQIDTFGIHPLVHLATRSWLKKLNQWDVWVEKAITRMLELVPDGDHITREVWTPYLPHAIHVSSMLTVNDANPKAELVDRVGRCQQTLGQYKAMEKTFRELLKYDDATLGPKHMNTLACLSHLGEALRGQGKYTEAKQIHRQTLQLTEEVFGKEHTETLTSKACLGLTLIDLGQYKEAEQMHREELALREKVSGKEHSYTLTSMNNLAMALEKQGKYKEAEQMHREELALTEKVSGKEHSHTLISMDNLAIALDGQGKHIEAEQLHRKALKLKEKVLGREHPSTLLSVNNLAITLGGQGKNKEAEKMHREELALREKVSGKEHPDTLTSMHNLALALSEQEKYTEAEPLHRKALRLREKVLGGEHPETLACMNELAVALEKQGKFEEAEQTQRSTLALREKVLGIEHPDTLRSVRWLANILKQQNRYKDALPLYKRAYEGNKKTLGSDHPYTRNSADWYAFAEAMVYGRPSSLRESSTFEEAYESSDDIFISDLLEARIYVEAEAPTRQEGDGRPSVSDSDDSVEGGVSLS